MNKIHFLLFIMPFLFFSCLKKNEKIQQHKNSSKINTISVIIDDRLWYGEVGDSIRNKFASPVIGLIKEEPLFTINQYPVKLLGGFMTDGRNIIVVKKTNADKFETTKNVYSSPQNIFQISGKSVSDIIDTLEIHSPQIIRIIRETEIAECQRINSKSLLNSTIITKKFRIKLDIPTGYRFVMRKRNFLWLKKEMESGSTSLLIYQFPISNITKNADIVGNIVRMRDSVGRYIKGREPHTQMITEEAYAPYFSKIKLAGKTAYETKGTWDLKNDFMTGPFINYAIIDKTRNRVLVLEGFCYSPSHEERDSMFELEAIIKSVRINNR